MRQRALNMVWRAWYEFHEGHMLSYRVHLAQAKRLDPFVDERDPFTPPPNILPEVISASEPVPDDMPTDPEPEPVAEVQMDFEQWLSGFDPDEISKW